MTTWYILDASGTEQRTIGPFSLEQLANLVVDGRLTPSTLVARAGAAGWAAAGADPQLAPLFGGPAPRGAWSPSGSASLATSTFDGHDPGRAGVAMATAGDAEARLAIPAYSFGAAFELAIEAFKARWGLLTGAALVFFAVVFATSIPGWLLELIGNLSSDPAIGAAMGALATIVNIGLPLLVDMPLWVGVVLCAANAISGRGDFGDILLGFRRYPQVLGAHLLIALVLVGLATACAIASVAIGAVAGAFAALFGGNAAGFAAGGIAAVASAGVLMLAGTALVWMRVFLAPEIAADPQAGEIGPIEALQRSWQATNGLGWSMLGLLFVAALLAAASILLLCVGYFVLGLPLLVAVNGAIYATIVRSGAPPMDEARSGRITRATIAGAAAAILLAMLIGIANGAMANRSADPSDRPLPRSPTAQQPSSPPQRPQPAPRRPDSAPAAPPRIGDGRFPLATIHRAEQSGAHRRQWTVVLDPAFEYEFMAVSQERRDIDLRILQRGQVLDEDLLVDHVPIVSVSGVSGEATLELILPNTTRRGDTIAITGERAPLAAAGASRAASGSGGANPGRIIAERTHRATRAGSHSVDFTYTLSAGSTYTFSAIARREIDIDLYLYQGARRLDSDTLIDHYPLVRAAGVSGEVRLRLRFPSDTRIGDEVDIVVRRR